jgi:hypothetical protein
MKEDLSEQDQKLIDMYLEKSVNVEAQARKKISAARNCALD